MIFDETLWASAGSFKKQAAKISPQRHIYNEDNCYADERRPRCREKAFKQKVAPDDDQRADQAVEDEKQYFAAFTHLCSLLIVGVAWNAVLKARFAKAAHQPIGITAFTV